MHITIALLFAMHGFAHLVGFVVPWRISRMEEMPYKTTLLNGKIDLGATGIRIIGICWLILALTFFSAAGAILFHQPWWNATVFYASTVSLILCLLSWPDARIGAFINLIVLVLSMMTRNGGHFS
jgi:hypothetical protein